MISIDWMAYAKLACLSSTSNLNDSMEFVHGRHSISFVRGDISYGRDSLALLAIYRLYVCATTLKWQTRKLRIASGRSQHPAQLLGTHIDWHDARWMNLFAKVNLQLEGITSMQSRGAYFFLRFHQQALDCVWDCMWSFTLCTQCFGWFFFLFLLAHFGANIPSNPTNSWTIHRSNKRCKVLQCC